MSRVLRLGPHNLGSCPRCRRLVEVLSLGTHAIGWPPVHSGPVPRGRETRTTVLVWDPVPEDRDDYRRLVGARAVAEQGFAGPGPGGHACPVELAEVLGEIVGIAMVAAALGDGMAPVEIGGAA